MSLHRKEDFDRVFQNPDHKMKVSGLYLLAKENTLPYSRLGMAVAKKVIKRATQRNALKRRLRAEFLRCFVGTPKNFDCVVVAIAPVANFDRRQMTLSVNSLFHRFVVARKTVH